MFYFAFKIYKYLKNKYDFGFYYINKAEEAIVNEEIDYIMQKKEEAESKKLDLRGNPTHECVCGSKVWVVYATFNDYEIGSYFLDMECSNCGTYATAPTLLDKERME